MNIPQNTFKVGDVFFYKTDPKYIEIVCHVTHDEIKTIFASPDHNGIARWSDDAEDKFIPHPCMETK